MQHINKFDLLHEDSTDASSDSEANSTAAAAVREFERRLEDRSITALVDLIDVVEAVLGSCDDPVAAFALKCRSGASQPPDRFDALLQQQLSFFRESDDSALLEAMYSAASHFDPIDIQPLIARAFGGTADRSGAVWLLTAIVQHRPDLLVPGLFAGAVRGDCGAAVCWICGAALLSPRIAHLDPLVSHQLLELFLPVLLSRDDSDGAVAVTAAHLIADAFRRQGIFRTTAAHYMKLQRVVLRSKTHIDKHVAYVIQPIFKKLTVVDVKDLAQQLFINFTDAPQFACDLIVRESSKKKETNASFLDGWVEVHPRYKETSMKYLAKVFSKIPEYAINKFPMEDLKNGGDLAALAALKIELTNASFRCIFLLFLVGVYCFLHYNRHLI